MSLFGRYCGRTTIIRPSGHTTCGLEKRTICTPLLLAYGTRKAALKPWMSNDIEGRMGNEMLRDSIQWEHLHRYPERPFVRHRLEATEPLRFARVLPGPGHVAMVSIIIPTLDADRGGYLSRLLHQIEQQTYKDWELILVLGDRK